ncbi:MAG TPA: patatin-like phospholipase family protein [Bryobacteraceae bacterium]|nr:patatin-like phospholipase family protein [Bryobacteraceae bacterium]
MNQLDDALREELTGVAARRGVSKITEDESTPIADLLDRFKLFGLAFSGGGIRSATFNLGVLQGLERLGLLKFVDYLSTVSGGGYIGSWYLSCLKQNLNPEQKAAALRHLRRFSRYLAPQAGLFSADAWSIAMVWIRNTLLLQVMLACLFAVLLLAPRFLEYAFLHIPPPFSSLSAAVLFIAPATLIAVRLKRVKGVDEPGEPAPSDTQTRLQFAIVLPLLAASALYASALWNSQQAPGPLIWIAALLVAAATCLTAAFSLLAYVRKNPVKIFFSLLLGALCGALFAGLSFALLWLYSRWGDDPGRARWLAGTLGSPAVLIALGLTVVVQIGLMGRAIDDSRREWWSRLGAFIAIYSIAALAIGLTAAYAPIWLDTLFVSGKRWLGGSLTLGGVATTLGGLLAAQSKKTGAGEKTTGSELLAKTAPYVFIAGLLILVSGGLHAALTAYSGCAYPNQSRWKELSCSINDMVLWGHFWTSPWPALLFCLAALGLLAWRIDINEASMNPFYRNRLVRAYMGAARAAQGLRRPNLFTGFDFADDYPLTDLRYGQNYQGPVPIVNAALNSTGGDNAAMEERRAVSFFFTPYHSGFQQSGFLQPGLRSTKEIGSKFQSGIRLGSCIATSGAAASPNMGYHTSAPVAFLLTFFNVRLGLWLRNPALPDAPNPQSPRWGLWYLLKELFASATARNRYLYLSDGGHFENLGVYELIRRRCRYIVACDAEQDENLVLEGLGGLVRKCRIDFGVEIDIDTSQIRQTDDRGLSRSHCAVGRIRYSNPGQTGYLVYLKASLTGDEDSDILQYKARCPAFPHESTGNQFYGESQFESYRGLGEHVVTRAFRQWTAASRDEIEPLMIALTDAWQPPSPFNETRFAHHAEQLSRLWREIGAAGDVAALDSQLFPGWSEKSPNGEPQPSSRRGLYISQSIIQLMENVYLDLNLETQWEHPDNEGWRVLFTRWAQSPIVQQAYRLSGDTYGSRFRRFCEARLKLTRP